MTISTKEIKEVLEREGPMSGMELCRKLNTHKPTLAPTLQIMKNEQNAIRSRIVGSSKIWYLPGQVHGAAWESEHPGEVKTAIKEEA